MSIKRHPFQITGITRLTRQAYHKGTKTQRICLRALVVNCYTSSDARPGAIDNPFHL